VVTVFFSTWRIGGSRGILGEEGDEGAAELGSSEWVDVVAARKRAAAFGERRSVRVLLPLAVIPCLKEFAGPIAKAGSRLESGSRWRVGSSG